MTSTKLHTKHPRSLTELGEVLRGVDEHLKNVFHTGELAKARERLRQARVFITRRKQTDHGLDELYSRAENLFGRAGIKVKREDNLYYVQLIRYSPAPGYVWAYKTSCIRRAVESIEDQLDALER